MKVNKPNMSRLQKTGSTKNPESTIPIERLEKMIRELGCYALQAVNHLEKTTTPDKFTTTQVEFLYRLPRTRGYLPKQDPRQKEFYKQISILDSDCLDKAIRLHSENERSVGYEMSRTRLLSDLELSYFIDAVIDGSIKNLADPPGKFFNQAANKFLESGIDFSKGDTEYESRHALQFLNIYMLLGHWRSVAESARAKSEAVYLDETLLDKAQNIVNDVRGKIKEKKSNEAKPTRKPTNDELALAMLDLFSNLRICDRD